MAGVKGAKVTLPIATVITKSLILTCKPVATRSPLTGEDFLFFGMTFYPGIGKLGLKAIYGIEFSEI